MALVYAKNADQMFKQEPPVKVGSNLSYGRQRVLSDSIDFTETATSTGDDIVLYESDIPMTIWDLWIVAVGTVDVTSLQLGVIDKKTNTFTALSSAIAPGATGEKTGLFDAADTTLAPLYPPVLPEPAFIVLRTAGAGSTGAIKTFLTASVE